MRGCSRSSARSRSRCRSRRSTNRRIELRPLELLHDAGNIGVFLRGYLHPSFAHLGEYAWQCVITVCIALWGTLLAAGIAVPLGLLGARNLAPHPVVYFAARRLMDLLRDGLPFAGAVYDPIARWLFTGCAGRGAWLNDRPLRVRSEPLAGDSLFAIRTPCEGGVPEYVERWLRHYRVRRFGSTALHLCYVALGGLDFVHDHRASLWDLAGAAPVVLEAGGVLTTDEGAAVFPVSAAQAAGAPIALLAGQPASHADAVTGYPQQHNVQRAPDVVGPLVVR